MQLTLPIDSADILLRDLLSRFSPGDEVVFTQNQPQVAKLVSEPTAAKAPRVPRLGNGILKIVEDDDEHLANFMEYMQAFEHDSVA